MNNAGAKDVVIDEKPHKFDQSNGEKKIVQNTGPKFGCRHAQILLLAGGIMCGFATKTNLSVAIVAMTDNTTSPNPNVPAYDWNNTSVILSSFFWSHISLQIVAGYLGKTYGTKYFLLVSSFINFCSCASIPLAAASLGSKGVIICRIFQGFGQAFLFPSMNVLLGNWAPEQERTTLTTVVYTGAMISSIFSALLTGYMSASWWGWPASFYILGGLGVCWCIVWLCFGQNSPASHPRITDQEKKYIQLSLKQQDNDNLPIPWKKILTSIPFYALLALHIGSDAGVSILMTETPTYLSKVMKFNVESNALISAVPDIISFFLGLTIAPLSDWLISRNILSRRNTRRIFNSIGFYGIASCIIVLSFLHPSQASWTPFVLGLGSVLTTFAAISGGINHLDLSPRYSGVLYGMLNSCGEIFSLLAPLSANWIVTDTTNESQWQILFLSAAGSFIIGGTLFFFFMSATRQSWDGPEEPKLDEAKQRVSVTSLKMF